MSGLEERDWDLLEATRDALNEYREICKERGIEIEKLKAELAILKEKLDGIS